jgi:hypothetical protein
MKPFTVQYAIEDNVISELLCCAYEGGSNYWARIEEYRFPEGISKADFQEGGQFATDDYFTPSMLIPLQEGCAVVFSAYVEDDDRTYLLTRAELQRGLGVMLDKYPHHLNNVLSGNYDAVTGDVFLQCCLFGHVVYG